MGNIQGKDVRIKIGDGATPTEVFTAIGGETGLDWSRSSQEEDISDKDSGIYGASSYGQQKISFKPTGNLKLPDAGFSLLSDASKQSPPEVNIEVCRGAVVLYKGKIAVGNLSAQFPHQGTSTWSCDMVNAGAPTVDALDADS